MRRLVETAANVVPICFGAEVAAESAAKLNNAERRHSMLGYVSPAQYERRLGRVVRAA